MSNKWMKINKSPNFACQKQSANEPNILTLVKIKTKNGIILSVHWMRPVLNFYNLIVIKHQQCVEEFRYWDRKHIFILNKIQIFGSYFVHLHLSNWVNFNKVYIFLSMILDANLSLFCVHPVSYHPHEEFEACTQCQQSDQLRNNFQRFLLIMSSDLTSCQEKSFLWNPILQLGRNRKYSEYFWRFPVLCRILFPVARFTVTCL